MNKTTSRIVNIVLIVAAYGYLGYKALTYDNYAGLLAQFRQAGMWQWLSLLGCVLLFPLNRFFEAWKWQYLVRGIEPMSIGEAQRQVYYGTIAGFVTPYKIGEYPGRALLFRSPGDHWLAATCLGLIGGYAMTVVIVLCGLPGVFVLLTPDRSMLWTYAIVIIGGIAAIVALPAVMKRVRGKKLEVGDESQKRQVLIDSLAELDIHDVVALIGMSLLRYGCWVVQLLLCLLFCHVWLGAGQTLLIATVYYLLVTVTPNVPVAEVAVRGAWAVVLFEAYGSDVTASAVIAMVLLWAVNTILPLIVGSTVKREK